MCYRTATNKGGVYRVVYINPSNKKQQDIYTSKGIITDEKEIQDKLYIGEIDPGTNKSELIVDGKRVEVPNIISMIYEMREKPYFASFKSVLNNNTESYYLIENNKISKQIGSKIYLYK